MTSAVRPRTPKRLLLRAAAIVALLVLIGLIGLVQVRAWRPDPKDYPLQGVDVSHHQGEIEWPTLAAEGAGFAYIKATEGGDLRDPAFARNWQDAADAGVRRGAYHFFTLCRPGVDQATNFIATVPRTPDALPPAIDLEFGGNCAARPARPVLMAEVTAFLDAVEAYTGKRAVLYVTQEFDEAYRVSEAFDRPLWLRRLGLKPGYGARPWAMWQASNIRRVDGVEGPVDWNVMKP